MIFRRANINDADNIAVLKQQVWIATYAVEGIRSEFSKYVLTAFTVENVQNTIKDNFREIIVAEINNHIVGCVEIALNEKCPVALEKDCPEIAVLYVLERFIGNNIGKKLLDKAIEYIQSINHNSLWLTVYHENQKAIDFYLRNQFKIIGSTDFVMDGNRYENKLMFREVC